MFTLQSKTVVLSVIKMASYIKTLTYKILNEKHSNIKKVSEIDDLCEKMKKDEEELNDLMHEIFSNENPTSSSREFYAKYGQKWSQNENKNPFIKPIIHGFDRILKNGKIKYLSPTGKFLNSYEQIYKYNMNQNINLSIDLFCLDPSISIYDEIVSNHIIKDVSYGREKIQIPCINEINYEIPDLNEYLKERRCMDNVTINTDTQFLSSCDCKDDCKNKNKCSCQNKNGYKFKRLQKPVSSGIFECNPNCKCSNNCQNKVVQNGVQLKLEVFNTGTTGWGVRCAHDIPIGMFICTYIGLIMDESTANIIGRKHGDEYFAEMDFICKQNLLKNFYNDDSVYIIDAKHCGNIGRFLNHSCNPNLFVQNVFVDTHDLRFPWVAFFANKNIQAGTELTWDYNYTVGSVSGKVLYCNCKSFNCRKRLL